MRRARVALGVGVLAGVAALLWSVTPARRPAPTAPSRSDTEARDPKPPVALDADPGGLRAPPPVARESKAVRPDAPAIPPLAPLRVRGRVEDRDGSAPPPGGHVVLGLPGHRWSEVALATDGSFATTIPRAADPDWSPLVKAFVDGWAVPDEFALIGPDGEASITLRRVDGTKRTSIRVVHADGRVAAGERLALLSSPAVGDGIGLYGDDGALREIALAEATNAAIVARTDGDGRTEVDLSEGALFPLSGRSAFTAESDPSPIDPGTKDATVTLRPAYGVELRLVDAVSNEPVLDADVALSEDRGGGEGSSWGFAGVNRSFGFRRAVVDRDTLPVRVRIEVDGRAHVATSLEVALTDADPLAVRTIQLQPLDAATSGELFLVTPWTVDRPGGHVLTLWRTKTRGRNTSTSDVPLTRTGPDRWTARLAPGAHLLRVAPAWEHATAPTWTATVEVRAGATTTVEPVLPPNGTLCVVASPAPPSATPLPMGLSLRRSDGPMFWTHETAVPREGWTLPFVPAGGYVLRVGTSAAAAAHPFTIVADRTTEVVVEASEFAR